ncbi:hypothetical protein CYMTET_7963 [Cymbomonas tetramitiformis]|uniref:Uncharacterized protein n=1 Tax=Cymbomonas tetramitiformis TaxID=36881 RepID=A0AAE0GUE7_9CHLO|nr:hypothetical protein CYMTET_7963 [Cymbomonas tetramitiformis]
MPVERYDAEPFTFVERGDVGLRIYYAGLTGARDAGWRHLGPLVDDEMNPEPGYVLSMHSMSAPTGVFADDDNIHAIDSDDDSDGDVIDSDDDESDGPGEIETGSADGPQPPVHPRFSTGGAGMLGTLLPVLCLSMFLACATAVPLSVILPAGSRAYGSVVLPHLCCSGGALPYSEAIGAANVLPDTCGRDREGDNRSIGPC